MEPTLVIIFYCLSVEEESSFARLVREHDTNPPIKLLAITRRSTTTIPHEHRALYHAVLHTPIQPDLLFETLQMLLPIQWVYAPEPIPHDSPQQLEEQAVPLLYPPQSYITDLLEASSIGDIDHIRQLGEEIIALDQRFTSFTDCVNEYINGFDLLGLREFLVQERQQEQMEE